MIIIIDNITQIKYIKILDKLYQVTDISLADMTIRAVETAISAASIKDKEIFDIGCLKEFKIKLINNGGMADIVDFDEFKNIKHDI